MQRVSKTSSFASAKTLVVFPKSSQEKILPEIKTWLTTPAKTIGNSIYAVLNIPKGKVDFPGMSECDIVGA